jgi:ABC-type transport system involved in cytochrome c biogenesis permease subunit
MKSLKQKVVALFFCIFSPLAVHALFESSNALDYLPIQEGGRIKPFQSFARESMLLIHGKPTFEKKSATEIIFTWILQPTAWQEKDLFEVKFSQLKEALKLDASKNLFSFNQLMGNERLPLLVQELSSKRESKEKLDPFYQSIQRLENQLFTFREIAAGRLIRIVPPKEGDKWLGLPDLDQTFQTQFSEISKIFVESLMAKMENKPAAEINSVNVRLKEQVEGFGALAKAQNAELYNVKNQIHAEVAYNIFHPFGWACWAFILSALGVMISWIFNKPQGYLAAWFFTGIGMILYLVGFGYRMYLTGRPPVSNMYETVVWVGFGAVVFAIIIELIYRWKFILLAGSIVSAFCLAIADRAPAVLDASLTPLEPVLRSNLWLTVHVLAFVLGDIGLILHLKKNMNIERNKAIVLAIYRSIQIGVALLAPGIILGGVWADYSWGRFWGWDPKETWALIALLGYLAVLHGRMVGLIKDLGMMASAVVTFSLVIMAWYGVNFVLGAGLHSYGFGAGGVEYVSTFVAAHLLFVLYVVIANRESKSKT